MAYEDTEDYKNLKKAQAREDADANEPSTESTADYMKRTGTKANRPKATFGGSKIVTKEQMKKAGFDNLRDYLNAERGLKRRDDKPAPGGPDKRSAEELKKIRAAADAKNREVQAIFDKDNEERLGPDKAALDRGAAAVKKIKADEATAKNKSADRPGSEVLAEKMEKGQPKMQGAYRESFGNIRKALGFKKGGKIESTLMGKEGRNMAKATMQKVASKAVKGHEGRMHKMKSGGSIDGIALRGKTRGRTV